MKSIYYEVYGEEQGYICRYSTLKEARQGIKELKESDKYLREIGEADIEDNYYIEQVTEYDDKCTFNKEYSRRT